MSNTIKKSFVVLDVETDELPSICHSSVTWRWHTRIIRGSTPYVPKWFQTWKKESLHNDKNVLE